MRTRHSKRKKSPLLVRGIGLVELMVSVAVGSVVLASVGALSLYGARSSVAMLNYTDLDAKSRYALDIISREIRQASGVTGFNTNLPLVWLSLTNATRGESITLTYDSNARVVTMARTGQPTVTNLTECEQFNFGLYQRTPFLSSTNVSFCPATNSAGVLDQSLAKLIALSWKCSRTILAQKVNTESVQAAQIVLRSKP